MRSGVVRGAALLVGLTGYGFSMAVMVRARTRRNRLTTMGECQSPKEMQSTPTC
jgi:hypothetical protein